MCKKPGLKFRITEFLHMISPMARVEQFYYHFWLPCVNRRKLKMNILTRKDRGYPLCTECGICCSACPCWDVDTRLCKIWDKLLMHTAITGCIEYPISPRQRGGINPKGKHICRFYWGEEEVVPTREEIKVMIEEKIKKIRDERGL